MKITPQAKYTINAITPVLSSISLYKSQFSQKKLVCLPITLMGCLLSATSLPYPSISVFHCKIKNCDHLVFCSYKKMYKYQHLYLTITKK